MNKKLRATIDLEAIIADRPRGGENYETLEKVGRFTQIITSDEEDLLEFYKRHFFDLLKGDYYEEAIHKFTKPKADKEFIMPLVNKLPAPDSKFFKKILAESKNGNKNKDKLLNLIYDQFGNAEITGIHFESV